MGTQTVIEENHIVARNPATGEELERIAVHTPEDVQAAIARARKAAPAWEALGYQERGRILARVRDRFLERADETAQLLHRENGKPELEAYFSEVIPNIDLFDFHIANDQKLLKAEKISLSPIQYPGKKGVVEHKALGVVGLISPWNYPVSIPLRTIIPALMTGNAVVFKPSEYAALSGRLVASFFAGLVPEGVLEVVQGDGAVGAALVGGDIDRVFFTGSVATGRKVATQAAERLVPSSLELGGKDAAIVLDDADLERAANGVVWGAFANAGQNCASVERVYVLQSAAAAFIEKVVHKTKRMRMTCDDAKGEVGPLINDQQLSTVETHVRDAVVKGAKVLVGGSRRQPGHFFEPTVLVDVDHRMAIMVEESFGPLLPIQVVPGVEDAVRLANDTGYGLTASIWSRDIDKAREIAARLHTGVATINNASFTAALPQAPWTGVKQTGSGVTNSRAALHELTRPRFTLVDRSKEKLEAWWFPYTQTLEDIVGGVLRMAQRGIGPKVGAVTKLLPLSLKRMKEGS